MRSSARKIFAALFLVLVAAMVTLTMTQTWDLKMETVLQATMFCGIGFGLVDYAGANKSKAAAK